MVKVYFESKGYSELVAIFDNEGTYNAVYPVLEKLASDARMIVTEGVEDEYTIDQLEPLEQ